VHNPAFPKYSDLVIDRIRQLRVICEQLNEGPIENMVIRMEPGCLLDELNAVIQLKANQLTKSKSEMMDNSSVSICQNYVFGRCTLGATCLQSHTTQSLTKYMEGWMARRLVAVSEEDAYFTSHKTLHAKEGFGVEAWMVVLQLLPNTVFNRLVIRSIDKQTAKILCHVIAHNTCPSVTDVDLCKNNLCLLYPAGVTKLANAILTNTTLQSLSISDNCFGNIGTIALLQSLRPNANTTLRSINLANNNIDFADSKTAQILVKSFKNALRLQKIGLACNNIGGAGMELLVNALSQHEIVYLDFYHCNVGDVGVLHLCEFIKSSTTLQALELGWNGISSDVITPLCSVLEVNRSLEALLLSQNMNIGRKGTLALADMLKKNNTLGFLDLRWTNPGEEGLSSLLEAMTTNRGMRSIQFQHNDLDPTVEAMANDRMKKRFYTINGKLESLESLQW